MTWRLGGAVAGAAVLVVIIGLRCHRSAPARLVSPRRHVLRPPGPAVRLRLGVVRLYTGARPPPPPSAPPASGIPTAPFETTVSGTVATSPPDADGDAEVTLSMQLADTTVPLQVRIIGPAVNGGVALRPQRGDLRPAERAGDGPRRVHHRRARHRADWLAQPDHEPVAESWCRHAHRPALREPRRNERHTPSHGATPRR